MAHPGSGSSTRSPSSHRSPDSADPACPGVCGSRDAEDELVAWIEGGGGAAAFPPQSFPNVARSSALREGLGLRAGAAVAAMSPPVPSSVAVITALSLDM